MQWQLTRPYLHPLPQSIILSKQCVKKLQDYLSQIAEQLLSHGYKQREGMGKYMFFFNTTGKMLIAHVHILSYNRLQTAKQ